ncbi:hypothetical protein [Levilactobacillus bambusae]|uniref:Accessory Sec system protein translocase subunit SecY2 n=1 Tax=Levilactobacillus bambusae TaxID=2024736 RepID=A0A2V1MY18_9LACO|nr:hypothetical protein [Levilactobacillus bambusae]PWF99923.1 hypothetical protein DCM90_02930 [Levilactobacillus bambusae]
MTKQFYKKIGFTVLVLVVLQLGQQVLIPQLDPGRAQSLLHTNPLLQVYTTITGAQYAKPTLFSIGMGPYMVTLILFSALRALGIGKKWTPDQTMVMQRLMVLVFAILQAAQMVSMMRNWITPRGTMNAEMIMASSVLVLVAGAMLVTWLSDLNRIFGFGGLGIMIVPGILASSIQTFSGQKTGTAYTMSVPNVIILIVATLFFMAVTEFFNHAELRLPIQQLMTDNSLTTAYLPIKVLLPGAMPLMFGLVVFSLLRLVISHWDIPNGEQVIQVWFSTRHWQGILLYALIIILLGNLFSYMNLMPHQIAEDMNKNGDYFLGVMPGEATEQFLNQHVHRIDVVANLYLVTISCLPLVVGLWLPVASLFSYYFSSLYMVVTILDNVIEQFRALYVSSHYELL